MTPEKQLEMWEKLHGCKKDSIYAHLIRAREIVESWPKWKQDCAYSSTTDSRYFETDSGARHRR